MAEVEYKGLKIGGSQWLVILPLLGTIVGGLWGGFQLYDRLEDAELKLSKVNPVTIIAEVEKLQGITEVIREELREDIRVSSQLARDVESSTAATQREIRNDVYAMERDMQDRFKEMDADIREMRKDLEERIQTILENPLNDVE
jgi:hypothetical protein